jgi:hypothetical protein
MPMGPEETIEEASNTVDTISNGKSSCGRKKKKYKASGMKTIPSKVGINLSTGVTVQLEKYSSPL